jgi:DNA-binding NtrC family response regulator
VVSDQVYWQFFASEERSSVQQKVIIFGHDEYSPTALSEAVGACGLDVLSAVSEAQLLDSIERFSPNCAVVLSLPAVGPDSVRITEKVRRIDHRCPLVILTSSISAESAIRAMRAGASDLLERDSPREKIIASLKSLTASSHGHASEPEADSLIGGRLLAGSSDVMRRIRGQVAKVAPANVSVLITGETGTGKELVAQLIHRNSRCSGRAFVVMNCAALPDTLLESELFGHERGAFTGANHSHAGKLQHASGGTLFLDEIGDMTLTAQAKVLRALENRVVQRLGSNVDTPVNFRLIAATNQDLETLTREKKFREDLYFRLNVVRLELPPLRERLEDIPELVEYMVEELNQRQNGPVRRVDDDLMRRLKAYHWPGNIRELRNVLESMLVFSSSRWVGVADLPSRIQQTLCSSAPDYTNERSKIISALNSANGNRHKAAQILCCSRMTLYRKIVKYSITA